QIKQHKRNALWLTSEQLDRLSSVACHQDNVPVRFQSIFGGDANDLLIVDNQDGFASTRLNTCLAVLLLSQLLGRGDDRKKHLQCGAPPWSAVDLQCPLVPPDDAHHRGQTQAAPGELRGEQRIED